MEPDNLENFESAFQKGLNENLNTFDSWLERKGINPRKLSYKFVEDYFLTNPEKAIIFQPEFQKIADLIGHYSREKDKIILISLIGVSGIGKTFFLKILKLIVNKSINRNLFDLTILDSCEKDTVIHKSINTLKNRKAKVILTSWNLEKYSAFKMESVNLFNSTYEIYLKPYDYQQSEQIIKKILTFISETLELGVKKEIYPLIYKETGGIPREIILFLFMCLEMQYNCKKDTLDEELVAEVAKKLKNLKNLKLLEQILKASENYIQKRFLRHLSTSNDPRGVNQNDVMKFLGFEDPLMFISRLHDFIRSNIIEIPNQRRSGNYRNYENYSIAPYFKQYIIWRIN